MQFLFEIFEKSLKSNKELRQFFLNLFLFDLCARRRVCTADNVQIFRNFQNFIKEHGYARLCTTALIAGVTIILFHLCPLLSSFYVLFVVVVCLLYLCILFDMRLPHVNVSDLFNEYEKKTQVIIA